MKRILGSKVFLAGLFACLGAAGALAITGNFPGLDDDEEPTSARVVERSSDAGTAFTSRTPAPSRVQPVSGSSRRTTSYTYEEDDYQSRLYEQYFGEPEDEEDDDYVYMPPANDDDGGQGGPAGPGGAGGGD